MDEEQNEAYTISQPAYLFFLAGTAEQDVIPNVIQKLDLG
jgi:hypothetical protein